MAKNSKKESPKESTVEPEKAPEKVNSESSSVSHNPAFVVWPTDIYGVTKEFKTAIMKMASAARGDINKKKMIDETIRIGLAHFEAKFVKDKELRDAKFAAAKAEAPVRF